MKFKLLSRNDGHKQLKGCYSESGTEGICEVYSGYLCEAPRNSSSFETHGLSLGVMLYSEYPLAGYNFSVGGFSHQVPCVIFGKGQLHFIFHCIYPVICIRDLECFFDIGGFLEISMWTILLDVRCVIIIKITKVTLQIVQLLVNVRQWS